MLVAARVPTPPDHPDRLAELARAAAGGDDRAFTELHGRFGPGLRRMFLTRSAGGGGKGGPVGREDLADDLSQRAWTLAWRAVTQGKYDPDRAAFSTFLYAVANNVWLQHLREAGRRSVVGVGLEESSAPVEAGADQLEDMALAQHLEVIRAALKDPGSGAAAPGSGGAGLTDQERDILRGSGAGESDRDLARRLSLAPSTINEKKQAALRKLRRFMATHGLLGTREEDG